MCSNSNESVILLVLLLFLLVLKISQFVSGWLIPVSGISAGI
jgi:hypothetical protein